MPMPDLYAARERPKHPFIDAMRKCLCYDEAFDEPMVRRAIAAYFGLTSFLDDNIGRILRHARGTGLGQTRASSTRVTMATTSARAACGANRRCTRSRPASRCCSPARTFREGNVCDTPVTLVDGFPTFIACARRQADADDADLPGHSLLDIAQGYVPRAPYCPSTTQQARLPASFMIRHGRYKYIHYVGLPPMLFDLEADPLERTDLGRDPAYAEAVRECEARLRAIVDPEAIDRLAREDQRRQIEKFGGRDAILKRGTFRYSPLPVRRPPTTDGSGRADPAGGKPERTSYETHGRHARKLRHL
jgi:choline-sulfatase